MTLRTAAFSPARLAVARLLDALRSIAGGVPACRRFLRGCVVAACGLWVALSPPADAQALPSLRTSLVQSEDLAFVSRWPPGAAPIAAPGTRVAAFAGALDHPRSLHVLPNGDVLVAETRAPHEWDDLPGLKGWRAGLMMKPAFASGPVPSRVRLLRDTDGDGVADLRSVLLDGLSAPFGMALVGDALFVATTDAVLRFPYTAGDTHITSEPFRLLELPAGPVDRHWANTLIASPDGTRLYVTVNADRNVGERGMEAEFGRTAIWELDLRNGAHRVFASGSRYPTGLAWEPSTGSLWTTVNEREATGSGPVPDYLTTVQESGFYGWHYRSNGGQPDERVRPERLDLVARSNAPEYVLDQHTTSLGLASSAGARLPAAFSQGMFIGQHGSFGGPDSASGHKVVFVPFADGRPSGPPVDLLTGFLAEDGTARGRPVSVALDSQGALLVADDIGDVVWRVTSGH